MQIQQITTNIKGADNATTGCSSGACIWGNRNWSAGYMASSNIGVMESGARLDVNTNTFKADGADAKVLSSTRNISADTNSGGFIAGDNNIAFGKEVGRYVG